jgi:hypothetical protein
MFLEPVSHVCRSITQVAYNVACVFLAAYFLIFSSNIGPFTREVKSRKMKLALRVGYISQIRNAYEIIVYKSKGTKHLAYLGTVGNNVKIHRTQLGFESVNWILPFQAPQWPPLKGSCCHGNEQMKGEGIY